MLHAGESVVIETHNGERVVVSANLNMSRAELEALPSVDEIVAETYLSVRLDALKGRVPFSETIVFPNNHLSGVMRSIGNLKEYD